LSAFFDEIHERYGDRKRFLRYVRDTLALHGISQGALSRRAGFHPTHVSRWLNEKPGRAISMESMVLLDEALDQLKGD
jgi:transcriptional regulator with XRE-family HTH domain